jgi:hypothetical protein
LYNLKIFLFILVYLIFVIAVSFNQPKLCPSATWNATGITFANISLVGTYPTGIFVNINNTVYVTNRVSSLIQVWYEGSINPNITFHVNDVDSWSLFVTTTDDIYIDNNNNAIDKWRLNSSSKVATFYTGGVCYDLFMDRNNSLYCALFYSHQVIKRSLNSSNNRTTIVGGTGCPGFAPNMLFNPYGIFVDINFNLYVADSSNNRIQFFPSGQSNAITVAGNGAPETITLYGPTDVVLDADGFLFIVDFRNNRIVGSGPTGFQCIIGCSGTSGLGSNQLYLPMVMAFDSYGNIFVTDTFNNRTQKFLLATNSCSKFHFI